MALDRSYVLEKLKRVYPDGVIYRDTYTLKAVSSRVHVFIHSLARSEGMSDAQWLTAQGFCWRDWEADMDQGEGEWNADSPAALADSILRRYPLIGQYELSGEEFSSLFSAATVAALFSSSPNGRAFSSISYSRVGSVTARNS